MGTIIGGIGFVFCMGAIIIVPLALRWWLSNMGTEKIRCAFCGFTGKVSRSYGRSERGTAFADYRCTNCHSTRRQWHG